MFQEKEASGAPRGGTNLSLREARAGDFLLKFKRKTGFHSAPKNVFPGRQWAPFCASEGWRGGRGGGRCALAPPDRLAPSPPGPGQPSESAGARSPSSPPPRTRTGARCPDLAPRGSPGALARAKMPCGPGRGSQGVVGRCLPRTQGPAGTPRGDAGWVSGLCRGRCPLRAHPARGSKYRPAGPGRPLPLGSLLTCLGPPALTPPPRVPSPWVRGPAAASGPRG